MVLLKLLTTLIFITFCIIFKSSGSLADLWIQSSNSQPPPNSKPVPQGPAPPGHAPAPRTNAPPNNAPAPSPTANLPEPLAVGPISAAYWPSSDEYPASEIRTALFTHIYYAFLLPAPGSLKLNLTLLDQTKIPEFIDALRHKPVKTLLSIGGASSDQAVFSRIASNVENRQVFIQSSIEVARTFEFDGLDLDWEWPQTVQDMTNLGQLFNEWRKALDREAETSGKQRLLLTSAVYYSAKFSYDEIRFYPATEMKYNLDWVSPMCFDYHGDWDSFTGMHAALNDPNGELSTSYGIGSWIEAGLPPGKLVMGLPAFGRTWKLKDPNNYQVGAPAFGKEKEGPGGGFWTYDSIVEFNKKNKTSVVFDNVTVSYYSHAGDSWVGYDDVESIKLKIQFAKHKGLAGYFFWALGYDKKYALSKEARSDWSGSGSFRGMNTLMNFQRWLFLVSPLFFFFDFFNIHF